HHTNTSMHAPMHVTEAPPQGTAQRPYRRRRLASRATRLPPPPRRRRLATRATRLTPHFLPALELLGARFASARAELRGADPLALPIPGVQSAGTAPLGVPRSGRDRLTLADLRSPRVA